jgi:hypothetical protein
MSCPTSWGWVQTERCIVSHPGEGGAINRHLGPGEQFALVARLDKGRWPESIQGQVGWYEIRLGPGEVGWVNGTAVAVNEHCEQRQEQYGSLRSEIDGKAVAIIDEIGDTGRTLALVVARAR